MKTPIEFYNDHKYAIWWTALYVFLMWAILGGLFCFDMFSYNDWSRLAHAQLRGFPGFVFGILILAMVPLYVATTTIIMRTNAPLFEFKTFKKIITLFTPTVDAAPAPSPEQTTDTPDDAPAEITPTKQLPGELCGAFNRARDHLCTMQSSDFDLGKTMSAVTAPDQIPPPDTVPVMANDIPLPMDFNPTIPETDFDAPSEDMGFGSIGTPTFTDISFDTPTNPTPPPSHDPDAVQKFLNERCIKTIATENDVIVTPEFAIATHDDDDFWVVDNESWFAAGKQKPAPDVTVRTVAATHGVKPILYLAATNIMDLECHREKWANDGIMVISNLGEIPLNPEN